MQKKKKNITQNTLKVENKTLKTPQKPKQLKKNLGGYLDQKYFMDSL